MSAAIIYPSFDLLHVVLVQWDRNFFLWFLNCVGFFSFGRRGKLWQQQCRTLRNVGLLSTGICSLPKLLHAAGSLCSHTQSPPHPFLHIQNDRRSPELILQQNHSVWSTQTVTLCQSLRSGEFPTVCWCSFWAGGGWKTDSRSTDLRKSDLPRCRCLGGCIYF